jgi:hypothetical protein
MRRIIVVLWFMISVFGEVAAVAAPLLRDVSPRYGPPGSHITLSGTSFEGWSVMLGETALPVAEVHADRLVVSLPPGASAGALSLCAAGQPPHPPGAFTVTP